MSADAALLGFISACRQRVRLLLVVRYMVMALASGCGIAVIAFAAGIPPAVEWVTGAIALTAAACVVGAIGSTPSTQSVAAELDRRLHLENAIVAALQVRETDLAVAPLVVRDAAARIQALQPAVIFPFELRRLGALLGISAGLAFIISVSGQSIDLRGPAPAGSSTSSGNPPAGSRDTSDVSPQSGSTRAKTGLREASGDPGRLNDAPAARLRDQSAVTAAGAPRIPTNRQADGPDNASVGLRPSQGPGTDRVDPTVGASATSPGRPETRGKGAGAAGGTGASAGGIGAAAIGDGAGAGGVQGTAVGGAARAGVESAPVRRDATRRDAAAQQFASTPAARDQVPPDLRAYVRAYFGAITAPREGR